jgi:hypothetical protein
MSRLAALVGGHVSVPEARAAFARGPPTEAETAIAIATRALKAANRFISPERYDAHGLNHPCPARAWEHCVATITPPIMEVQ